MTGLSLYFGFESGHLPGFQPVVDRESNLQDKRLSIQCEIGHKKALADE